MIGTVVIGTVATVCLFQSKGTNRTADNTTHQGNDNSNFTMNENMAHVATSTCSYNYLSIDQPYSYAREPTTTVSVLSSNAAYNEKKCKTLGGTLSVASSRCACSPANITHIRECAMDRSFRQTTHIRACAMDRSRKLFRLFSRHISGTQSFRENRHIIDLLVVHNPLVPLIGRLVACSARTRTDRQTDRQNDYCNPRCACAPRVNNHTTNDESSSKASGSECVSIEENSAYGANIENEGLYNYFL